MIFLMYLYFSFAFCAIFPYFLFFSNFSIYFNLIVQARKPRFIKLLPCFLTDFFLTHLFRRVIMYSKKSFQGLFDLLSFSIAKRLLKGRSKIQTISYHAFPDKAQNTLIACSQNSDHHPLTVNCAGTTFIQWPFRTKNAQGRKDFYFLYLKTGTMKLAIGEIETSISSNTLVVIPPDTPYAYSQPNSEPLFYYWIHFTGSYALSCLKEFDLFPLPLIRRNTDVLNPIEYQMQKMFDTFIKNGALRDAELSHCMDAILIEIAKHSHTENDDTKKLSKSIKYIHANYTSDIKIPDLAAMEFLSSSRYSVLFNRIIHTSPYQYIINLRLKAACEMLRDSNLGVTQIAELLGFQSCFFFSKLFKKHLGISPLQYRKNILLLQESEK